MLSTLSLGFADHLNLLSVHFDGAYQADYLAFHCSGGSCCQITILTWMTGDIRLHMFDQLQYSAVLHTPTSHGHYEAGRSFLRPENALRIDKRAPSPLSFDPDTDLIMTNMHQTWDMRSGFPSWSWAGWKHVEDTHILFNQPLDIRSLLSFYSVTFSEPTSQVGSKAPTNAGPIVTLVLFDRCGLDIYRMKAELQDHLRPPAHLPLQSAPILPPTHSK